MEVTQRERDAAKWEELVDWLDGGVHLHCAGVGTTETREALFQDLRDVLEKWLESQGVHPPD